MKLRIVTLLLMLSYTALGQYRMLVSGCNFGEVAVYAADGSKEWSMEEANEVSDAWLLPNNDIAMSYKYGARVVRPDWKTKTGFEELLNYSTPKGGENHTCQPLPDGGFLIGESFDGVAYIVELDNAFKETKRIELKGLGGKHSTFRKICKTPQGTYLITQQRKNGVAMEIAADGTILRKFPDGRFNAVRLENGNTLIACGDKHRIIEVDSENNVVWALERDDIEGVALGFVATVKRLPNGNTLFCNWGGHVKKGEAIGGSIIEVSPDKKLIWSASPGKANRISSVQVLGE